MPVDNPRIVALDWMRGLVMVLMAVDHASIMYNSGRIALDSAATYSPGMPLLFSQFLTRWITHVCAPTFIFLAGTALALNYHKRRAYGQSARAIDGYIVTRGLIIASFDLVVIPVLTGHKPVLQVLFAIGTAMVAMVWLRRLGDVTLLVAAIAWLLFGEVLTTLWWDPALGNPPLPIALTMAVFYSDTVTIIYPVVPWLAVMMLGWVFGRYLVDTTKDPPSSPAGLLIGAGTGLLGLFFVVRGFNHYGNMMLLRSGDSLVQWLHVSKYPPSLSFISLELGLMALCLAALMMLEKRVRPRPDNPLLVFGQTALFFYLLHLTVLATPAVAFGLLRAGPLIWAYGAAAAALIVLYPICRWYRNYKFAHPDSFTRYI